MTTEPDLRGRIPGTARHAKSMMASGSTRDEAVLCGWCSKGATLSDDILLALDAPISKSTGMCEACSDKMLEGIR